MKAGSPDPAQGYDRSSLWLFHSAVQSPPATSGRDRHQDPAAPVLIQRLEPRAAASAERPAEAKPAQAPDFPRRASRAGCGLLTRSGNAAFRRQPPQTAKTGPGLQPRQYPAQPLPGSPWHKWLKWLKAAAWTLAFLLSAG